MECLTEIFRKPYAYVGMMGSKKRAVIVKKDLEESGFSQENISGLHSPIGLEIGGQTPEEIALSVISEIVKCKNERTSCTQVDNEVLDALIEASDEKYILCTHHKKEWQCTARSRNTDARELRQSDHRNYRRRLCGGRGYKPLQETVSQAGVQMRPDGCEHEH